MRVQQGERIRRIGVFFNPGAELGWPNEKDSAVKPSPSYKLFKLVVD
jgi:hypothetical protein